MSDLLGQGFDSVKELLAFLLQRSKSKNILKNKILRELRDNLLLLEQREADQVDLPGIVKNLSASAIGEAFNQHFKFSSLSEARKVLEAHLHDERQKKYLGWTMERLCSSIEGKVTELKRLADIYPDFQTSSVQFKARLNNLYHQLILLSTCIYKGLK